LTIDGDVATPLTLQLDDIRRMRSERRSAVIECAGNGRGLYELPATSGVQWGLGAVSNATWTGVPLRTLLERAGVQQSAQHFWMEAADQSPMPAAPRFLRSIPRDIALSDAFIACEMNGQPVPLHHGGPLRLIVPGWYGMASTKWLTHVHARATESDNHFMARGYRWPDGSTVSSMRVKSLITAPLAGEQVKGASVRVTGVAWTGAGTVSRVEISTDGGQSWQPARVTTEARPGTWRLWEADVPIRGSGEQRVRARATDSAGNTQPERAAPNPPGYGNNSIHEVRFNAG
jgi:DMSO/TMAO reductase YedYZ molybdopterin-dependent catalytic subunit